MVLDVNGESENEAGHLYYMERFLNGQRFKTMIDTGSPVTIFAVNEIKKIMKRGNLQVRRMVDNETYVDFKGKPLNLLGYIFSEFQVVDQYVRRARIFVAKQGVKSIIGREWVNTLKLEIVLKRQKKIS